MKYGRDSRIARCIGAQLAIYVTHAAPFIFEKAYIIVPVPLSLGKLFTRGFNQSELMGKALSRLTGIPLAASALRRVADFSSLAGKSAKERKLLTREAFRINSLNRRAHENIILLDDVATTLETLNACTREIKSAWGSGVTVYGLTASRSF